MEKFIPFKEVLAQGVIKKAKELAWNKLSKEEQQLLLKQAKEEQDKELTALAIKCVEEAEKAFSEPGFVSRADPKAYSDYKLPKKPKKK